MKIGERVYVQGYIDEIRKDVVIIRNDGGYFGTAKSEIVAAQEDDTSPVKHGFWQGESDGYADGNPVIDMWHCSCCGKLFEEWETKPTWKYCPNCGARMDLNEVD